MSMITTLVECPTPTITHYGSFTTIRFDRQLAIQLDETEWIALVDAIAANAPGLQEVITARILRRNEDEIRRAATTRESLQ